MLLIFYTLYRREIKVKTESTAKVMGEVVAFDSKNQLLISLPVVEYQVEGERYQRPLPTLILERLLPNLGRPMFSIDQCSWSRQKSGFADDIPNRVSHDSLL